MERIFRHEITSRSGETVWTDIDLDEIVAIKRIVDGDDFDTVLFVFRGGGEIRIKDEPCMAMQISSNACDYMKKRIALDK